VSLAIGLIVRFLNTRDERHFVQHADKDPRDRDELHSTEALRHWLIANGLSPASTRVSRADLALTIQLRDALRGLIDRDRAGTQAAKALNKLTRELPLTVDFAGSRPTLTYEGSAVSRFLADVLAGCVAAGFEGRWSRLKMCAAPDCRWVFHDDSRNSLGRWCNMNVCGNRVKTRNYRARRRPISPDRIGAHPGE
jgi:predicted RNA-binding Zn ribbon-like protein